MPLLAWPVWDIGIFSPHCLPEYRPQRHPCSKEGPESGTGLSPPVVCCTIRGSPRNTLQCSSKPTQVSHVSNWKGWPVRCLDNVGWGGGANDLPKPCRGSQAPGGGTRAPGGVGNHPTYPQLTWGGFGAWGSCHFRGDDHHAEEVTTYWTSILRATGYWVRATFLKDVGSLVGVPFGAQLDLTYLGSMQIVMTQNTLMGELWYHCETRVISQTSLHLTLPDYPDQHNTNWELDGPWTSKPLLSPKKNLKFSE